MYGPPLGAPADLARLVAWLAPDPPRSRQAGWH